MPVDFVVGVRACPGIAVACRVEAGVIFSEGDVVSAGGMLPLVGTGSRIKEGVGSAVSPPSLQANKTITSNIPMADEQHIIDIF